MHNLLWLLEVLHFLPFTSFSNFNHILPQLQFVDNFYEDGIDNVTDPLWKTAFHNVYKAESLQIPWYPILGNHDYHVDPQAQIDRTFSEDENMWTMPARYYVFNYTLPNGGLLSVVNIDTQLIDTGHDDTGFVYENSNWEEVKQTHLQWIDDTLAEQSKIATWVLVAGHYPIYSVGVNGDNSILLDELYPILVKHKIHAYIAGHDHSNQFIPMDDGITHIVSAQGAGRGPFGPEGVKYYGISKSTPYITHYSAECGFAFVKMNDEFMNVSFVNANGKITYTGVLSNPHTEEYRQNLINSEMYDNDPDDGSGNSNNPHTYYQHYAASAADNTTALIIFLPGVFFVTLLVFYIGRNTAPIQAVMTSVTNVIEVIQGQFHDNGSNGSGNRNSGSISTAIDVSTRSDVGLTSDMDRSGRRANVPSRSQQQTFDSASLSNDNRQYKNNSPSGRNFEFSTYSSNDMA